MNRIAFFSDIHANLPALEAFFEDVKLAQPDAIYCLGDLVGYNVWPNEVIQQIRNRHIPCIAGNYDYGVGRSSADCGCAYKNDTDKEMGAKSIGFTNSLVTRANKAYLRSLPAHLAIEFKTDNDETIRVLMVHGSPRKINEYLFEDRDEKSMIRIFETCNADILLFGHTHKPYHRIFEYAHEGKTAYRHAINIGSVGKPKDGDPRACYALLALHELSSIYDKNSIQLEFRRVSYDVEKAASAVQDILPAAYADMLRNAY